MPRTIQTRYAEHKKVTLSCPPEEGRTKQASKDECDINLIFERVTKGGQLTHINESMATFGDFSVDSDFFGTMRRVRVAEEAFQDLPGRTRDRFANRPEKLFEFLSNPENLAEAVALGLVEIPAAPEIPTVNVGNLPDPPTPPE